MRLQPGERARLRLAAALVVGAVLVTAPIRVGSSRVDEQRDAMFPVAATQWLVAEAPPGELFNEFDWGGYLMLHAPDYRVAIDGRTDVYDDFIDVAIATADGAPGWEAELDREGVNVALLHTSSGLSTALRDDPGWVVGYQDDLASVFVRR
jgi:hypothetical protein